MLALSVASRGSAATAELLRERFTESYRAHYQPRFCGLNCLSFVQALHRDTGDARSLYLVQVENRGSTVFGMVNAEATRGSRFGKPAVEEANWYHHAFLVDERGLVYDFDFMTEPTIVPVAEYIERMFLDEAECLDPKPGEFCAGRENKLRDYELTVTDGNDAVAGNSSAQRKLSLGDALRDWRLLLGPPPPSDCADAVAATPSP